MSGSSERSTRSAGWPASTARRWSPEEPNEVVNFDTLAAVGVLEGGDQPLLEGLLRSRVGNEGNASSIPTAGAAAAAGGDNDREGG